MDVLGDSLAAGMDTAALSFTAAFAGLALHSTLVDVPMLLDLKGQTMITVFGSLFPRLRSLQTYNIAIASALSLLRIALFDAPVQLQLAHAFNALILVSIFAYTVKVMLPGNQELVEMARSPSNFEEKRCRQLIENWGDLHFFRTLLSCTSVLLLTFAGFWTMALYYGHGQAETPLLGQAETPLLV